MKASSFKNAYVSNLYDVMSDADKERFSSEALSKLHQTYCINFDDFVEEVSSTMDVRGFKSCDALLFDFINQNHLLIEFKGGIISGEGNPFSKGDKVKEFFAKLQDSVVFLNAICKKSLADMDITGIVVIEKTASFYSEKIGVIGIPVINDIRERINNLSSNTSNLYPIASMFPYLIEIPFIESVYTTDKEGLNVYVEDLVYNYKTINPYSYPNQELFNFYNISKSQE